MTAARTALVVLGLGFAAAVAAAEPATIDSLDERTVELPAGGDIEGSAAKARASYRRFLQLSSRDPRLRAEAMRRLAELELEASEAAQVAEQAVPGAHEEAVELFESLLESWPDHRRNDSVMYQLARAHESAGRAERALEVLDELVARYPASPLLPEVQFRRGEMLFLRKEYAAAESAYDSVVAAGSESRFYEQSLYKLGWSRFKLARHEESLDPFFALLDGRIGQRELAPGEAPLDVLPRAERELVDDTLRVLAIGFSYMDGPASIDAYLGRRASSTYSWLVYLTLGDLYLEKERFADAAAAYEAFVLKAPYHRYAPALQAKEIEAYRRGDFASLVLEGKEKFVGRYGMDSRWWVENARSEHPDVERQLKANLSDLAQYHHAKAQDGGGQEDYRRAATWYRKYLDWFPRESDSAATNFLLAEILYESHDYEQAAREYERTAYDYPEHERAAEAGYAALLAYRAREEALSGAARAAWHDLWIDSSLRFTGHWPGHPESGRVLATVADDLFHDRRYERAVEVSRMAVYRKPPLEPPHARTAWTVMAHSLFDLERYAEAEAAYHELRGHTPRDENEARAEIGERIAASIYRQGELARDAGELEAAVTHFMRVGQAVPDSPVRETAEYDAAAALMNLGAWDRAASVLESFRRTWPGSEFAGDVSAKLAVAYLESGRHGEAAGEFERIADSPASDDAVRREALWRAAELYRSAGASGREERALEQFVERYPRPVAESIEARARLLALAEAGEDEALRRERLEAIVHADETAGSERSDRTRYLAATASLALAEPAYRRFMALGITQPLAASLKRKKARMEEVLAAYGKAADYGVAEVTTAATFRLGEVYHQFSRDLMSSERPADLDADALEQYDLLLEEQAFPFEEEAIALFEANVARAADGTYDEWVRQSFDALAELVPARYAKLEQSEDAVTVLW